MTEEDRLQCAVIEHLRLYGVPGTFWFHCPNGGSRHVAEATKLKRMGTKPGIPDLILLNSGAVYFLELKTATGKLSKVQKEAHLAIDDAGFLVATTYGLDEALETLRIWGFLQEK